ncbi:hypothetical protein [Chromobacterium sp. ASV23]|uniref:hypothetical protein n=1 Tax=Chromobacterium sp. ASV23 TaxID=2795110 RepID=UPI001E652D6E|nr:hypothetical protein [Chromobacterium sp. ASV23]
MAVAHFLMKRQKYPFNIKIVKTEYLLLREFPAAGMDHSDRGASAIWKGNAK